MADALLSPAVGGTMLVVSAAALAVAVKKSGAGTLDEKKIPLMGIMGAFVFAAQMINFTIPATGSSGHIGGGVLLAALLGPWPAFITLAVVLLIQCLFFADGGLLAYGCNVFNMGFVSALAAWVFVYRPFLGGKKLSPGRLALTSFLTVVAGLQLGAFCVVLETTLSGVAELPFSAFALLMQPIHLAIGAVEGAATAAVLVFVYRFRPEIIKNPLENKNIPRAVSIKKIAVLFIVLSAAAAGLFSLFASSYPDGLEWSMENTAGTTELERESKIHELSGSLADSAPMPGYAFKNDAENPAGTAAAGLAGSLVTVIAAGGIGLAIAALRARQKSAR
ncbi:MAG: energy-coupling factor ABC transporter permease [Treponema sp.]|nr:energy-coupling factor ABC transporter permease [Treponema sp.]